MAKTTRTKRTTRVNGHHGEALPLPLTAFRDDEIAYLVALGLRTLVHSATGFTVLEKVTAAMDQATNGTGPHRKAAKKSTTVVTKTPGGTWTPARRRLMARAMAARWKAAKKAGKVLNTRKAGA